MDLNRELKMTKLQQEYVNKANKRWNIKAGGVYSGKRYLNFRHTIPFRILDELKDELGEILFIAHSKMNVKTNIVDRLRNVWGKENVSIVKDNVFYFFGQRIHVYGATRNQKKLYELLRKNKFKYIYGDEVGTWSQEIFESVKDNLERHKGIFDGVVLSLNLPDWYKKFIKEEKNIFIQQNYTIYENDFGREDFKKTLLRSYNTKEECDKYIIGEIIERDI